jgi:hypothetical protein
VTTRDLIIAIKTAFDGKGATAAEKGLQQTESAAKKTSGALEQLERKARDQGQALAQAGRQAGGAARDLDAVGRTAIKTRQLLESATKRLPEIEITADSSDAERDIADLARRLRGLADKRIGIDLDAGEAAREAESLRRELTELAALNPELVVSANVDRAIRDLERVERHARDLDRTRVDIPVEVSGAAAAAGIDTIRTALAALRSSGPLALVAVSAGIAALPGVAALAAAAVTTGLGAALAGLGLAASHGSDAAQDAIGQLKEAVEREAASMGEPFEKVWTAIVLAAEQELAELSPVVRRNLAELAPEFQTFAEQGIDSLSELEPAIDGIQRAFSAVLRELGPRMPQIMEHLARAVLELTTVLEEQPDLLANFAVGMAQITEWTAKAVAELARLVKWGQENANTLKAVVAVLNPAAGAMGLFADTSGKAGRESLNLGKQAGQAASGVKAIGTAADEASVKMREGWASAYAEFSKLGSLLSSARERASDQETLAQAQERAAEVQRRGAERIAQAERDLADAHEQSAERVAAAKQRVKDAHRQAAQAIEAAQGRVRAAQEAVTRAIEAGAEREAAAQQRVADARARLAEAAVEGARRVADAQQRLADAHADAAARQVDADRRVQDAHRRTQDAVEDLTAARERARDRLEDLIAAESGAALDEEGAQLAIERARQRLNEINADPEATDLDRREADLAYRQALQRLEEVRRRNAELREDLADAQRRGIDGSAEVVDAIARIEDARRAEVEAETAAARQREENNRSIADAERALADAQTDAARQRQDAARQLSEAETELGRVRTETAKAVKEAQEDVSRAERDAAQVAKDAARDVKEAKQEAARVTREASREIEEAEQRLRDTRRDTARETREANDSVLESWAKLRGDAKLTSEQLLAELEKQVKDQEEWAGNLISLAGRVPPEMLAELAELGPGAAGIVATAADMSDVELKKFIDLYGRSGKGAGDTFAKNLQEAGPVLARIGETHGQNVANRLREAMDNGRVDVFEAARRIGLEIDRGIMGDRVITIRTEAQEFAARISQQADGGILDGRGVRYFAAGGEHHVAQIASGGTIRVWAEPETGGEAYIPLAMSKRARSEDILSEVAERFGGRFFKTMPISGPSVPAGDGGGMYRPHVNHYSITVQVPPMANMAEAGAVTVRAIQEFERRSGSGWRS